MGEREKERDEMEWRIYRSRVINYAINSVKETGNDEVVRKGKKKAWNVISVFFGG